MKLLLENWREYLNIQISRLLNDPDVIDAAIQTTKTAAVVGNLGPERITRNGY